jgi:phosphohistidine swiveling domain-containing protein
MERDETIVWTNDNVGEVIPGVVTPLSWSVLEPLSNGAFRYFLRQMGVRHYPQAGLFGLFYGRVYFNSSRFQDLLHRFYPSAVGAGLSSGRRWWRRLRAVPTLLMTAVRAAWLLLTLTIHARRYIASVPLGRDADGKNVLPTTEELLVTAVHWRETCQHGMRVHLAITIFANLLYELLNKLVQCWRGGAEVTTAELVTGLPGMRSAEVGRSLRSLARRAAANPEARRILLSYPPDEVLPQLRTCSATESLVAELEMFLVKHGHSSQQEFELMAPRWRDGPTPVLSMLQGQVLAADGADVDEQATVRQRATQAMRTRLTRGLERLVLLRWTFFALLLRWTQDYSVLRENMKYAFVLAYGRLREKYLALAGHLVENRRLDAVDDIFFLRVEELPRLVDGGLSASAACDLVAQRRRERELYLATDAPPTIEERGGEHRQPWAPQPDRPSDRVLRGLAASPGCITARARVMFDPSDAASLRKGEVLIAPATNPSWSPLFLTAGALVTEIGGLLSHGAIVAREYGLPAVLNVKDATKVIRTGQLLTVDGWQGTIYIENSSR